MLPDRTIAYLEAAQSVLDLYDKTMDKRRKIQLARRRTDREIAPLFRKPFVPNYPDYEHMRALHILCDLWSLYGTFDS
jgi:hypothetical protein